MQTINSQIRICTACDKHIIDYGYIHEDNRFCRGCWRKYIYINEKEQQKKNNTLRNPRHLNSRGRTFVFKENPRKGVCEWCHRKKGDVFITTTGKPSKIITHIHHIQYHEDDPLKDTVELCNSCHAYETWRLGQHTKTNWTLSQLRNITSRCSNGG